MIRCKNSGSRNRHVWVADGLAVDRHLAGQDGGPPLLNECAGGMLGGVVLKQGHVACAVHPLCVRDAAVDLRPLQSKWLGC